MQRSLETQFIRCQVCGNKHDKSQVCATQAIRFHIEAPRASNVFLVGSWSSWQRKDQLFDKSGVFQLQMHLWPGRHQYKYIVDGIWKCDESSPKCGNEVNGFNNYVQVYPKTALVECQQDGYTKITSHIVCDYLQIIGSWDWKNPVKMTRKHHNLLKKDQCFAKLVLQPGKPYEYKLKLGQVYLYDERFHHCKDGFGSYNNLIFVKALEKLKCPNFNRMCWSDISIPSTSQIYGHSITQIGQFIYIFGGNQGGQISNVLFKFNPRNSQLISISTEGNARAFHGSAKYGNKILFYSGVDRQRYLQDYLTFNTISKEWTCSQVKGESPTSRQNFSCLVLGNRLIIFGGYYCHGDMEYYQNYNDVFVLDLQNLIWDKPIILGEKPTGRKSHSAALHNNCMYVFGGCQVSTRTNIFNDMWRLNLDYPQWFSIKILGQAPSPRYGHSMQSLGQFLVVFGGKGFKKQVFNDVFLFNTKNEEWSKPEISGEAPRGRWDHATEKLGEYQMVVFGGRTQQVARRVYVLKFG